MSTLQLSTPTTPTSLPLHPPPAPNLEVPPLVYRVHRPTAQTRYHFSTGFAAKNQTTIINYTTVLHRFAIAHLHQQTNISSPFVSVYTNKAHAEAVARHFANTYHEDTWVVTIDTEHLPRGPPFWASHLLKGYQGLTGEQRWLHDGEYLFLYRIHAQAVRDQTLVARGQGAGFGVIGHPHR